MKENKKKWVSLFLCVLMLISNFAYAADTNAINMNSAALGEADRPITRGELARAINSSFGYTETDKKSYKDVMADSEYYTDLLIAKKAGYFPAKSGDKLIPEGKVSRQEMAYILKAILGGKKKTPEISTGAIKDLKKIKSWSKPGIAFVLSKGFMELRPGKKFSPEAFVSKNELMDILKRCLSYTAAKYGKAGKYSAGVVRGSVMIDASGVVLEKTVIYGDLIIGEAVGNGDVTLSDVVVKGDTIVNGGGMNTITVENSDLKKIKVIKLDNKVRILAKGTTRIATAEMYSGGKLEESDLTGDGFGWVVLEESIENGTQISLVGTYENVEIIGDGLSIGFSGGTIETLTVSNTGSNSKIDIGLGAVVKNLVLNGKSIVSGLGKVGTVASNVEGSSINVSNYQGTASASSGTSLPASVSGSSTGNVSGTAGTSSGSTGGSSRRDNGGGSGGSGGPSLISITGVSDIIGTAIIGNTITAGNVNPSAATVTYQWQQSSSINGTYSNISGATGKTYILTSAEENRFVRLVVIGTGSYTGTAISKATEAVKIDPDTAAVMADKNALTEDLIKGGNASLAEVTSSLAILPSTGVNGSAYTWTSSFKTCLSNDGQTVVRPSFLASDKTITLSVEIKKGTKTDSKSFTIKILKEEAPAGYVSIRKDLDDLLNNFPLGSNTDRNHIINPLPLPSVGPYGSTFTWFMVDMGTSISKPVSFVRPAYGAADRRINLIVEVKQASFNGSINFPCTILAETVAPDNVAVAADKNALTEDLLKGLNESLSKVKTALATLPTSGANGSTISWVSDNTAAISNDGQTVVRPSYKTSNSTITFTATIKKGAITDTKSFNIVVLKEDTPAELTALMADADDLLINFKFGSNADKDHITSPFSLPATWIHGSSIAWKSSDPSIFSHDGLTLHRPPYGAADKRLFLTAELKNGIYDNCDVSFPITVLAETEDPDTANVEADLADLTETSIKGTNRDLNTVVSSLSTLPITGAKGSSITWTSDKTETISNDGQTVARPVAGASPETVILTATLTKGSVSQTKSLTITVLPADYEEVTGGGLMGTQSLGNDLSVTPVPYNAAVTYQWQRAESSLGAFTDISGANASSYMLTADDLGKYIRVALTGTGKFYGTGNSNVLFIGTDMSYFTYAGGAITGKNGLADTVVFVPGQYFGTVFTSIGDNALKDSGIIEITIPDNIKNIGTGALAGNNLTKIKIGSGVTIGENLLCGDNAFREAYLLGGAGTYIGTQNGSWTKTP